MSNLVFNEIDNKSDHHKLDPQLLISIRRGEERIHRVLCKLNSDNTKWEPNVELTNLTCHTPRIYQVSIETKNLEKLAAEDNVSHIEAGSKLHLY